MSEDARVVPTLLGCRCATPSSEFSRSQWKPSSHQPHNYATHTACRIHKTKEEEQSENKNPLPNRGTVRIKKKMKENEEVGEQKRIEKN